MRIIMVAAFLVFFGIVTFSIFAEVDRVEQNTIGFAYNVSDGRPVNAENNPPLAFGWHIAWGYDAKFFIINSEVNSYNFTADEDKNSPYNEALTWDSTEGVTMQGEFTILGRVTDPWKFYEHYGIAEHSYSAVEGIQDAKIYEALRQAGQFVDVKMGELCENVSADEIRKNPQSYAIKLTRLTAEYAEQFGFTITDVIFPERFSFPGGDTITKNRQMLQDANSSLEKKKKEVKVAEGERDKKINSAKKEAANIIAEGDRVANDLTIEARAIAEQLKAEIERIDIEGAMKLKMTELQGEILRSGVIVEMYLTENSIIGSTFYNKK